MLRHWVTREKTLLVPKGTAEPVPAIFILNQIVSARYHRFLPLCFFRENSCNSCLCFVCFVPFCKILRRRVRSFSPVKFSRPRPIRVLFSHRLFAIPLLLNSQP